MTIPRELSGLLSSCLLLLAPGTARANSAAATDCDQYVETERREFLQEHPGASEADLARYLDGEQNECEVERNPNSSRQEEYETVTRGHADSAQEPIPTAGSSVDRRTLEERMPRSSPEALRYEPGVYLQQTAHAQGSAYIRGLTGQQTLMLFDGIRLNNSLYRQGPNQYFFTVDSRSVSSIAVTRGSASVLYGSDALGGVIEAHPIEPALAQDAADLRLTPRTELRAATADDEVGGRFELDAQYGNRLGLIAGVGYRTIGLLESGGPIRDSVTKFYSGGERELVPQFADDGRTQLGTGFREATEDARLVYRLGEATLLSAALYDYRQLDAPRTDQCPPAFGLRGECLTYEEQFRTLGYVALQTEPGSWAAQRLRATASLQRQHERRRLDRPESLVDPQYGRDDAWTAGVTVHAETPEVALGSLARASLQYGLDAYRDHVSSVAWYEIHSERTDLLRYRSRGQYLDGSRYTWGGLFANVQATLWEWWHARAGVRGSHARAHAPADDESGTVGVDQGWTSVVAGAGLAWDAVPGLTFTANVDQGFRAPNLDDLTSRQQTGPGFQFENPDLVPEKSLTLEAGMELSRGPIRASAWAYRMTIADAMARRPAAMDDCPPQTPQCNASWFAYQLFNLDGTAEVVGVEGLIVAKLPFGLQLRATAAYTRGEGQNPAERPSEPDVPYDERVPLSRIPPLNGTIELVWRSPSRAIYVGAALRWAAHQDRLAPQDEGDARIPLGGTPGFAVMDVRAGYRLGRRVSVGVVGENLGDASYRYHGSSVNGPGRGVIFTCSLGM